MSRPPVFGNDYEKVKCDDFINGIIEEVQEEEQREFNWQGKVSKCDAVRMKFKLDGYDYPHYSRWGKFNYGEKSNLYKKYLLPLVEGAEPVKDKDSKFNGFDIQQLAGMRVKTLWSENDKGYQSVETIRPLEGKIVPKIEPQAVESDSEGDETPGHFQDGEEVPF